MRLGVGTGAMTVNNMRRAYVHWDDAEVKVKEGLTCVSSIELAQSRVTGRSRCHSILPEQFQSCLYMVLTVLNLMAFPLLRHQPQVSNCHVYVCNVSIYIYV